jgi:hypothetical protein
MLRKQTLIEYIKHFPILYRRNTIKGYAHLETQFSKVPIKATFQLKDLDSLPLFFSEISVDI